MTETFIVVLTITLLGYTGTALPPDAKQRIAHSSLDQCRKQIPAVRRTIGSLPVMPDKIDCIKLEVK